MSEVFKQRVKVGIVIDYTIRIPDFKECYHKCKTEIISGMMSPESETQVQKSSKDKTNRDFWISLHQTDPKNYSFYETCLTPQENYGPGFDYTYKKYFANNDHRIKFLDDWSYNLFGQGAVVNPADISLFNICQSKVADVVLIDRTTHARKIPNTLAFLSRVKLFPKEIRFISKTEELEAMRNDKGFIGIYDPIHEPAKVILPSRGVSQPSEVLINWLMEMEKKSK